MNKQLTKQDIFKIVDSANQKVLSAISEFSTKTDQRFKKIENEIIGSKSEITGIKSEITGIKSEIADIKSTLSTQVVTKDYLDQKIAEVRGDFTAMLRKKDNKLGVLTSKFGQQKILPPTDVKEVLSMEPFPKAI